MAFKSIITVAATFITSITLAVASTAPSPSSSNQKTYSIGVIQTIEHPALDKTCQGIRDELTAQGFKDNLTWTWESAQMNQGLAIQIAQKFVGQQVDMIIAIGTLSAQAALSATRDTTIPIVFSSVTDPKSAKLIGNITGVSNFVPVETHFDLITKILPKIKNIGVIYNTGDVNSVTLVDQMEPIAQTMGLTLVRATVAKTSDVSSAATSLIGKVDAIYINNDNTALAAFDAIAQVCKTNKIPLFASDTDVLDKGALAVRGPDQYDLGRQTGRLVVDILTAKTSIKDVETQYPEKIKTYLNEAVATELNITFPESIKNEGQTGKDNA